MTTITDISVNPSLIGTTSTYSVPSQVYTVPVNQEPQLATENQLNQQTSTIVMWCVIIFITIILILIIAGIVYWASRPVKVNVVCADQADCAPGNYCSSSGICIPGSGATSGTSCGTNDDCRFGLACISGTCGKSTITELIQPCTPISTPAKFRMKTVIGGTTYYIVVNSTNSVLTTSQPNDSYTYNNSTEILSLNSNLIPPSTVPIGVHTGTTNNGQMYAAAGAGHDMCISGTLNSATLTLGCGSILEYAGPSTLPTNVYFPAVSTSADCSSFPVSTPSRRVSVIIEQV